MAFVHHLTGRDHALHERDAAYRNGRLVNLGSRKRELGTDLGTSAKKKSQTPENSA